MFNLVGFPNPTHAIMYNFDYYFKHFRAKKVLKWVYNKVCTGVKQPIQLEIIQVSMTWSDQQNHYSPLDDEVLVHHPGGSSHFPDNRSYPFRLLSGEALWEWSVLPKNTTLWPSQVPDMISQLGVKSTDQYALFSYGSERVY